MRHRSLFLFVLILVLPAVSQTARAAEKVLCRKGTPDNLILVTEDERGLRTLRFEERGARQSVVKPGDPDHLELAYARVMPVGLAFVENPRRVLVVGLGGGTIPSFLRKHFPQMAIDVVEIDPRVVDVAKRYFGFREDASMRAYVGDGRRFIEKRHGVYDIIFLDAYGCDSIPYHLATREFLVAARRALAPGGVVVGNVWSRASNRLYDSMLRTYQDVFEDLYIVDVQGVGNQILIAVDRERRITRASLTRAAGQISKQRRFGYDMGECVERGFEHLKPTNTRGRVLRDGDRRRKAG